jgi:hypothetical protein
LLYGLLPSSVVGAAVGWGLYLREASKLETSEKGRQEQQSELAAWEFVRSFRELKEPLAVISDFDEFNFRKKPEGFDQHTPRQYVLTAGRAAVPQLSIHLLVCGGRRWRAAAFTWEAASGKWKPVSQATPPWSEGDSTDTLDLPECPPNEKILLWVALQDRHGQSLCRSPDLVKVTICRAVSRTGEER